MIAASFALWAGTAPASAATTPITDYFQAGSGYPCTAPSNAPDMRVCSGHVPSFDGALLDVDLTMPANDSGGPHPLIVMLHGFGNNKHEWESTSDEGDGADKYHWNSHWFATKGYYVLTYTARGFRDNGTDRSDEPGTASFSSADSQNATIRLKSRDVEIRDTQWLSALVANSFDVDPHRLAVTGGSYGGGESWVQASQSRWTFPHDQDSSLPVLDLQVAVPKYPWTDLAYSLAPNGHGGGPSGTDIYESSQGHPDDPNGLGFPGGIVKTSYVGGFFALGTSKGVFEEGTSTTPTSEGPINIPLWNTRVTVTGDPYDVNGTPTDPVVEQTLRGLTEYRSSYYQDEGWAQQDEPGARKVAVYSIQGWTDDLFPAVESFRQFKYLKRLDPNWPVEVAVADIGHSRAQNPPGQWQYLNQQANQWLAAHIGGSHEQQTGVSSLRTVCGRNVDQKPQVINGRTPEDLASGTLTVNFTSPGVLAPGAGTGDPDNLATDPVVGSQIGQDACRTSQADTFPGRYTALSSPLTDPATYAGLGYVNVHYTNWTGDTSAQLLARLWDVEPGGATRLVTRGVYRLDAGTNFDSPITGNLRLPFFGNNWRLERGHQLRLDITQVDTPTFRPSQVPDSISFDPPKLVLPTHEAGSRVLAGG
ncbi:MAG: hypothetical protein ACJ76V_08620 [Thermoleophilaceae bacterium]